MCRCYFIKSTYKVLRKVEGTIENVTKNKNSCILMYGQNGSGKTFTLEVKIKILHKININVV